MKKKLKKYPVSSSLFSDTQRKIGMFFTIIAFLIVSSVAVRNIIVFQSSYQNSQSPEIPFAAVSLPEPSPDTSVLAIRKEQEESQPTPATITQRDKESDKQLVEVQKGDNFWKISKRICGKGIYYMAIKEDNGYTSRTLKPGDMISVTCSNLDEVASSAY